jgi:succinate dehydrogenase / fumarate reductase cytochrome b subunit
VPRQFAYYPGCVAEFSSKELNATTCCGAGDIAEAKPNLYLTLNVRILSEAEEMGADIMTICNVCTLNLRRANKMVKEDPRLLEQVNGELVNAGARPYQGTLEVTHLLWYLATEEGLSLLEQKGPRGLNGLKVAPYYGCQLLRPSSVMGFEDPDRPQSLERLITALGGEVADYEGKTRCCGFPIILAREEVALKESHVALSGARDAGAQVMVTPCPLCHLAMDAYQRKTEALMGEEYAMPVLHLPQLIGLALGMPTQTMEFKRHFTSMDGVLETVGA